MRIIESEKKNHSAIIVLAVVLGIAVVVILLAAALLIFMPFSAGQTSSSDDVQKVTAEELMTEAGNAQDVQSEVKSEIVITGDGTESAAEENAADSADTEVDPVMADFEISASSVLKGQEYSYEPSNMADMDTSTCWAEGVSGDGTGESITFASDQAQDISGLAILPGYCKSRDLYDKNGAPAAIRIECGGRSMEYSFSEEELAYHSEDPLSGMVYIPFDETMEISECIVTITGVRDGNRYDDCCISEMFLYR